MNIEDYHRVFRSVNPETHQKFKREFEAEFTTASLHEKKRRLAIINNLKIEPFLTESTRDFMVSLLTFHYWSIFDPTRPIAYNIESIHYLLRKSFKCASEQLDAINAYCEHRILTATYVEKSNLVDALIPGTPLRENLMAELRMERTRNRRRFTIYTDRQNVHNTGINASANVAKSQFDLDLTGHYIRYKKEAVAELKRYPNAFDRIETDDSNLVNIFCHVWHKIRSSPHKSDLIEILSQELNDMDGLCTTGHSSRLINVLSGYDDDIGIKMDYLDEIIGTITARVQSEINAIPDEKYRDDVMSGFIIQDPESLIEFIQKIKTKLYAELYADYKPLFSESFTKSQFNAYFDKAISRLTDPD
jgi:hypothetical protein